MPFDPQAPTEEERSYAYTLLWFGLAAAIILAIGNVTDLFGVVSGAAAAFVGAQICIVVLSNRWDDYFRAVLNRGAQVAVIIPALWIGAQGFAFILGGAYRVGFALGSAGGSASDRRFVLPDWTNDAYLLASLAVLAFYVASLWHHYRGGSDA